MRVKAQGLDFYKHKGKDENKSTASKLFHKEGTVEYSTGRKITPQGSSQHENVRGISLIEKTAYKDFMQRPKFPLRSKIILIVIRK